MIFTLPSSLISIIAGITDSDSVTSGNFDFPLGVVLDALIASIIVFFSSFVNFLGSFTATLSGAVITGLDFAQERNLCGSLMTIPNSFSSPKTLSSLIGKVTFLPLITID